MSNANYRFAAHQIEPNEDGSMLLTAKQNDGGLMSVAVASRFDGWEGRLSICTYTGGQTMLVARGYASGQDALDSLQLKAQRTFDFFSFLFGTEDKP